MDGDSMTEARRNELVELAMIGHYEPHRASMCCSKIWDLLTPSDVEQGHGAVDAKRQQGEFSRGDWICVGGVRGEIVWRVKPTTAGG